MESTDRRTHLFPYRTFTLLIVVCDRREILYSKFCYSRCSNCWQLFLLLLYVGQVFGLPIMQLIVINFNGNVMDINFVYTLYTIDIIYSSTSPTEGYKPPVVCAIMRQVTFMMSSADLAVGHLTFL